MGPLCLLFASSLPPRNISGRGEGKEAPLRHKPGGVPDRTARLRSPVIFIDNVANDHLTVDEEAVSRVRWAGCFPVQ